MFGRIAAGAVLAASLLVPTVAGAASPASVRLAFAEGPGESTGAALVKDGTTFIGADLWEAAGLQVTWDRAHRRAAYVGWKKSAAIRLGSRTAMLDGKPVDTGAAPFELDGRVYVPLRFAAKVLGGTVTGWDAKSRTATVRNLHTYAAAGAAYGGVTYTVEKATGQLYASSSATGGRPVKIAHLGSALHDLIDYKFKKTPKGLLLIEITDVYGEPHINNAHYALLLKNGSVIRQAKVHYWQRFAANAVLNEGVIGMTDGRTLRVIEDGTGDVLATHNLVKLGGLDEDYIVEAVTDDFLLIRPTRTGLLTFVDLRTGTGTQLYKVLLDAEMQEYAELNDSPYRGDWLVFVRREGNELLFRNEAPIKKDERIYRFALPED